MLVLLPRLPASMSSTRHSHLSFSTRSPAFRSCALQPSTQTQASRNSEPPLTSRLITSREFTLPRAACTVRSAWVSSALSARRSTSRMTLRNHGPTCSYACAVRRSVAPATLLNAGLVESVSFVLSPWSERDQLYPPCPVPEGRPLLLRNALRSSMSSSASFRNPPLLSSG